MFDRPRDSWYIYMRPFRVALLLQMRNIQRNAYLQEKDANDKNNEKDANDRTITQK